MQKAIVVSVLALVLIAIVLQGQAPPGRGQGGGARGGSPAAASGPMLDLAAKVAEAINKQDASALQKLVAPDAVYLDEDGHALPVPVWITKLTTGTPAKTMSISATHSQMYDTAGWVSFNYVLMENFKNAPLTVKGTASLVAKKTPDGEWQITLIHGAMEQHVAGFTQ
jgi:ketosteroid isomerase-like protein